VRESDGVVKMHSLMAERLGVEKMADSFSRIGEWCNIREAAAHLNVSVSFVRKMVRGRRIPFARAGTKVLRFRRRDLDTWLESNGHGIPVEAVEAIVGS